MAQHTAIMILVAVRVRRTKTVQGVLCQIAAPAYVSCGLSQFLRPRMSPMKILVLSFAATQGQIVSFAVIKGGGAFLFHYSSCHVANVD